MKRQTDIIFNTVSHNDLYQLANIVSNKQTTRLPNTTKLTHQSAKIADDFYELSRI